MSQAAMLRAEAAARPHHQTPGAELAIALVAVTMLAIALRRRSMRR